MFLTYQQKASYQFREPENGKWADEEEGAVKALTSSDEIVVPASMPDFISPHIATWGRYDWMKHREDESLRLSHRHGLETAVTESRVTADVLRYLVPPGFFDGEVTQHREADTCRYRFLDDASEEIRSTWLITFCDR